MDNAIVLELDIIKAEIEATAKENDDISDLLEKYGELSIQLAISNGDVRNDSIRGF